MVLVSYPEGVIQRVNCGAERAKKYGPANNGPYFEKGARLNP
jgi:hypothetical protein